jgi:ABC-type nitrate/sulfonate/bicarbonate transport system ATPase subunit
MSTKILMKDIFKTYKMNNEIMPVLDGVSLNLLKEEFVSIIGPSGCGKSTILKIICGLDKPDDGLLLLDDKPSKYPEKIVSYMPQKDHLLPWRNVLENVILAREVKGDNIREAKQEALQLMHLFGLKGFENSYPSDLSGGMRQRAALMRTFLSKQQIMLLDEPFGALDAITRTGMQKWLLDVWKKFKQSILFITHDIDEAIFLSDRIYVLTPRPAQVCLHLEVDLPRPRDKYLLTENKFLKVKKKVMEYLLQND